MWTFLGPCRESVRVCKPPCCCLRARLLIRLNTAERRVVINIKATVWRGKTGEESQPLQSPPEHFLPCFFFSDYVKLNRGQKASDLLGVLNATGFVFHFNMQAAETSQKQLVFLRCPLLRCCFPLIAVRFFYPPASPFSVVVQRWALDNSYFLIKEPRQASISFFL